MRHKPLDAVDDDEAIIEEVRFGDFDAVDEDFPGGDGFGGVDEGGGGDGETAVAGEGLNLGAEG